MTASMRHFKPWLAAAVLSAAAIGCGGSPAPSVEHEAPARVEALDGDGSRHRITLSQLAAQRLGIEVAAASAAPGLAGSIQVPYSAIIYDAEGNAWTYVAEQALVFVREPVTVDDVLPDEAGGIAVLSQGPAPGTSIVSVGVAELFGTEFEIGH